MGLLKKQLLKVIEWTDTTSDTIVYKFPLDDRYALMKGSQLVVRPSQKAVFVNEGKIADIFDEGRYSLDTANLPILTALLNWKYAFENPFKGDIYFINTRQFTDLKWGTQNPIMMRDTDFGMIRVRGYGAWAFRVNDEEKAIRELFGVKAMSRVGDVSEYFRRIIVSGISDAMAECKIPALDLASQYTELGDTAQEILNKKFNDYGLTLTSLVIENISLPEEVEKAMDTRTSMGIMGDKMGTFAQYQAAQAMRDAAQNTSGGNMAGAGVGLGAGVGIGKMMADALSGIGKPQDTPTTQLANTKVCTKCGASMSAKAKFCPECGAEAKASAKFCPECGAEVKASAKFCPECGTKLGN